MTVSLLDGRCGNADVWHRGLRADGRAPGRWGRVRSARIAAVRHPEVRGRGAVPPLSGQELTARRASSPVTSIGPAVCARLAGSTGLLAVLVDADGRVLWRAGERKTLRRGENDGHGDGACLAEHSVGTSGVSLALASRHPIAVCGPEHYCPGQHDLVCVGAPWPAAHRDMLKLIDQTVTRIHLQLASQHRARRDNTGQRLRPC
jgi:hypothetical protein